MRMRALMWSYLGQALGVLGGFAIGRGYSDLIVLPLIVAGALMLAAAVVKVPE